MDRKKIADIASKMQTKEDLLALLNFIKKEMANESGIDASHFHPFTLKQLNFYCNPNHDSHRYRKFKIKKKTGGFRDITAPRNKCFKMLLQAVNEMLKALYVPSEHVMGFTEGRSVATNAAIHKAQNYVFNIDLKDFFPSIEQARLWKRLQVKPYKMPSQIASIIAGLCSMRIKREHINENAKHENDKHYIYVLPQGAPTSPILTNMVSEKLDFLLSGLARRFGLHYTRYADDITFSSMHYVYSKDGAFRTELKRIITEQGFTINDKKTRLQKRGTRQEVTGVIVNQKLNVTQRYARDIRNILHIWKKFGYNDAYSRFLPKYKTDRGHVKKGNPDLINVIEGKLLYMKMVKGENDTVYKNLYNRFIELKGKVANSKNTNSEGTTFIKTLKIAAFEKEYSKLIIGKKDDGKPFAYFIIDGMKQLVSVNAKLKPENLQERDKLAISLCRGADEKSFWLIHRRFKVNVPPPPAVDIDKLNKELESLLNT